MILELLGLIGVFASFLGIYWSIQKIVRARRAEKKFKQLLNERPNLKEALQEDFVRWQKTEKLQTLGRVYDNLMKLSLELPEKVDRDAIYDLLANNTQAGRAGVISDFLYEKN